MREEEGDAAEKEHKTTSKGVVIWKVLGYAYKGEDLSDEECESAEVVDRAALVSKGTTTEEDHNANGELKTREEYAKREAKEAIEEHDGVDEIEETDEDDNEEVESRSALDKEELVESPLVLLLLSELIDEGEDCCDQGI